MIAMFRATGPRQLARITVIAMTGVHLLFFIQTNRRVALPSFGSTTEPEAVTDEGSFEEPLMDAPVDTIEQSSANTIDPSSMPLWQYIFLI